MPCDFEWSDVGNLEVFLSLQQKHTKQQSQTFEIDSSNNLVQTKSNITVLIGVNNLCIVEQDGILVITQRDQTEKIKNILPKIKEKNLEKFL